MIQPERGPQCGACGSDDTFSHPLSPAGPIRCDCRACYAVWFVDPRQTVPASDEGETGPVIVDPASWDDLKELDEHGEDLTQWEIDFVESLMQQLRNGRRLTAKQHEKLAAIREERL